MGSMATKMTNVRTKQNQIPQGWLKKMNWSTTAQSFKNPSERGGCPRQTVVPLFTSIGRFRPESTRSVHQNVELIHNIIYTLFEYIVHDNFTLGYLRWKGITLMITSEETVTWTAVDRVILKQYTPPRWRSSLVLCHVRSNRRSCATRGTTFTRSTYRYP